MSESNLSRFFEQLNRDAELAGEYQAAVGEAVRSAVWPAITEVAAKRGLEFSTDELGAWMAKQQEELSEEALEGVAGGILKPTVGYSGVPWVPVAAVGVVAIGGLVGDDDSDTTQRTPISP